MYNEIQYYNRQLFVKALYTNWNSKYYGKHQWITPQWLKLFPENWTALNVGV